MNELDLGTNETHQAVRVVSEDSLVNILRSSASIGMPVVIALTAKWAGPCRGVIANFDVLASDYRDKKVIIAIVDVDEIPQVHQKYGVRNVPTVMFFDDKGLEVGERFVGAKEKAQYETRLKDLIKNTEQKQVYDIEPFEIIKQRFITRVRRYRATKDHAPAQIREGDILEEIFNSPNCFYNLNHFDRIQGAFARRDGMADLKPSLRSSLYLKSLNGAIKQVLKEQAGEQTAPSWSHDRVKLALSFEEMETIDVKESETFKLFSKKVASSYKSKLRSLGNINEDLTILRYMLDIEDEGNTSE